MAKHTANKSPSLRQLYGRGMRLLSEQIPHLFLYIVLHGTVMTVLPYIHVVLATWFLQTVLDGNAVASIASTAVCIAAIEAVLALSEGWLRRVKEAKWDLLYRGVDRLIIDKLLRLDYADLNDPAVTERLHRVRETTAALGVGLVQLPDMVQNIVRGTVGIVTACALTGRWLLDEPSPVSVGAAVILVIILAVSVAAERRSVRPSKTDTEAIVKTDRVYYAFYESMFDPSKAADARLYRQDRIITRYLEAADRAVFDAHGAKFRAAYGKVGVMHAFAGAVRALWYGAVLAVVACKTYGDVSGLGTVCRVIGAWMLLPRDVEKLWWSIERVSENAGHLKDLYAFLDTTHRLYHGSLTTEKRTDADYELEFRRVSFTYPSQTKAALSDVSVVLKKGSRTAIVGENGSGKSTFVKLLCRLYDPDEGEILLNGIDIRKYRYEEYVDLISAVFQDFGLPVQSLGSTVAGTSDYDADRVKRCLQEAGLSGIPFETVLYKARTLSRGEEQAIAVARALYKEAPLRILDEPTSALDPTAEATLYQNLDRIVGERTAVFVSHRLSSCRFCDDILVFDRGRIVQRGTHEALVSQTGKYQDLWNAQAMYYKRD